MKNDLPAVQAVIVTIGGAMRNSKWVLCMVGGILAACLAFYDARGAVDDNRLVRLEYHDEPLSHVLEKISAQSGVEIVLRGEKLNTTISGRIDALPLEDALRKLLSRFNHTIIWDEAHRSLGIVIYDASTDPRDGGHGAGPQSVASDGGQSLTERRGDGKVPGNPGSDRSAGTTSPIRLSGEGRRFVQGTRTTP